MLAVTPVTTVWPSSTFPRSAAIAVPQPVSVTASYALLVLQAKKKTIRQKIKDRGKAQESSVDEEAAAKHEGGNFLLLVIALTIG